MAEIDNSRSLLESVRADDLGSVSRLLRSAGAEEAVTAALVAAREGHEAGLKLILEAGAVECDARDENGWTLLRTAAWSGQHRCVAALIQAGAQVMTHMRSHGLFKFIKEFQSSCEMEPAMNVKLLVGY